MSAVEQQVKNTLRKAFWEMMHLELKSEPPKYDRMLSVLEELRDTLCNFVPNRTDIHKEIKETIDIELIKNMVENNAFEDKELYQLTTYIVSMVKKFIPPIMDESVAQWEQEMLDQLTKKFHPADFLVIFFQSVFHMLEHIMMYAKKFADEYDTKIAEKKEL